MLENPVVNGYNTTTLGAMPMEIDSGAQNKTPFIYNEENVSIDKLDDLKNIKFNISIYDSETMSNLFTSEQDIPFKSFICYGYSVTKCTSEIYNEIAEMTLFQ